ncbi:MAG: cytidine deaminase, partial [Clostridiales Family XIII bacterium]|nr:cytidine deaminase [Clostridiales Family XIII bacterium]
MTDKELYGLAVAAMAQAYAPYSGYKVGAALLTKSGEVFCGANAENASYGASICAERAAFTSALSAGHRKFAAIAIAANGAAPAWPCGICRQFIFEFGDDIRVLTGPDADSLQSFTIAELLPNGFRLSEPANVYGKETVT